MKTRNSLKIMIPAVFGIIILIFDSRHALEGATEGLEICIRTVIPSLFPFIFLSSLLAASLKTVPCISSKLVCRLFRIPQGCGGLLLTGLLGGYPIGAKCIGEAVTNGQLSRCDGERMVVFCNAAGPAFMFGITGSLFTQRWVPWSLWGIHLFSAICTARLLPAHPESFTQSTDVSCFTVTQTLRQSVKSIAEICGWIILMRIFITILQKWCLWHFPLVWQIFVRGILELSNGCISLAELENTGLRFILCSIFLGFGGLCVALQTSSAASAINQKRYLPGKLIQGFISFISAYAVQFFVFGSDEKASIPWFLLMPIVAFIGILIFFVARSKKSCGILESVGV